ncbi:MAG: hypothetical protein L0G45_09560, partial [Psychrobacter sp.]|nr:hypothetical protein [Psychrobacter sp.]
MTDTDNTKQDHDKTSSLSSALLSLTDEQRQHLEDLSKHIEVLLHASEAPLTATVLRKHLSLTAKELTQALALLRQRLDMGVLSLHETASGYRLQIANNYSA